MTTPSSASPPSPLRTLALILLPIFGIALVAAVIYATRSKDKATVTVIYAEGQAGASAINTGDIVDATRPGAATAPRLGYRYKVFVDDESDDRSSGIAKIGGRATFIPEARRGQTALVDVTRVRDRVVDAARAAALLVVVLGHGVMAVVAWPDGVPRLGNLLADVCYCLVDPRIKAL